MKLRLPVILVLFFVLVFHVFSGVGDVYFCEMTQLMGIYPDGSTTKYYLEKFKFKREQDKIIFGNEDNFFVGMEMNITFLLMLRA